jgi:N-acetylglucosaminyl-diphospho-decaprenol L-rhamnosyltransferase
MTTAVDVSVVIVNWNSREILRQCLASIAATRGQLELEVIVIDSGSFDRCGEMLREHYPATRFIQSETNLGFAKANNEAARQARGQYVLFLNPDTEIVGGAIQAMRNTLEARAGSGIAGVRLLNADGTVQTSCVQSFPTILNQVLNSEPLRRWTPTWSLWGTRAVYEGGTEPREVEGISGACLMLRNETFVSVGWFSEDYFMYAEDMDLAYRVRAAGCTNYYVPTATVVHYGGSSSAQAASAFTAVMLPEAIRRFLRRTRGKWYASAYRAAMGCSALVRLAVLAVTRSATRSAERRAAGAGSARKWTAILRWSLKRDGIVGHYYPDLKGRVPAVSVGSHAS